MKFFIPLFAASAAASSFATPSLGKRQGSVVQAAIASVSSATSALNTAIQGFSGAGQVASLQASSDSLLAAIQAGTSSVSPIATLSNDDAFSLVGPIGGLATLVSTTVDNAIAKKATFVSAGAGKAVYDSLIAQQAAAKTFSDTTLSKVPEALRPTGQGLAQPIADALARGVAAFADQANAAGPTSGAPTSGAPSSTVMPTGAAPTGPGNTAAASYTDGPVVVKPTSSVSYQVWQTTTGAVPKYTGAAVVNAANSFGAAAVAALAAAAML